jgi:chromosome segregation ATPase
LSQTQQQLQQLQQQHNTLKSQVEVRERELTQDKVKWELDIDALKSKLRAAESEVCLSTCLSFEYSF